MTAILSSNDPGCFHVLATNLCGPAKWKSAETGGPPWIMSLKPAMRFFCRLYTIIGNDQGEWPPDDDML